MSEVFELLKNLQDDPESVRRAVLGYANSGLVAGWARRDKATWDRCVRILYAFEKNFYDTGKAGLSIACLDALK